MQIMKKVSVCILAILLTAQLAACSSRDKNETTSPKGASSQATTSSRPSAAPGSDTVESITPDFLENVEQAKEHNPDSVGWLQVPGTLIEDVVLHKPDDPTNQYSLRRDFEGNYSFNGVYYADFRSSFGDGSRVQLGVNTCIYGHAMTDEHEDEKYDIKFGNLHDFRDPDFAKKHPYIYFSTEKENMVFEIIAVFVANADNLGLQYNNGGMPAKDFVKMVKEEVFPRSKYKYDVELDENDKFLTLSTCIYTLDNGTVTGYPDTYYRYAVMARLVDPGEALKTEAAFTENPDVIYDPDGKWPNQ